MISFSMASKFATRGLRLGRGDLIKHMIAKFRMHWQTLGCGDLILGMWRLCLGHRGYFLIAAPGLIQSLPHNRSLTLILSVGMANIFLPLLK